MRVLKILTVMVVLFGFGSSALQAAEIVVGMPKDKVIAVKGNPTRKDTVSATDELWYYADGDLQVGIMGGKVIYVQQGDKPAVTTVPDAAEKIGMEFIKVPAGCFQMGSKGDKGSPVHEVCVSGFEIGKYEVTQGQWKAAMGSNPSHFTSCGDNCPVEQVSWDDAQGFIRKLNAQGQGKYRLPTEAEWEYACRSAGKPEEYCGGNDLDRVAWYDGTSGNKTHPVGQKAANGLGIYDMSGNVWEWTCSDNGDSDDDSETNKHVMSKCSAGVGPYRVIRGGSWNTSTADMRFGGKISAGPGLLGHDIGFRLLRTRDTK
ncbi:MAG: SUMF1/EgtB/PvdO family nonheme iron enzyme [Magnetococcus sp. YQC-3]